ncbi:hypothetical protein [Kordiimonas marina]|uniref:hypothetical protein n=1 Tax=Kordiimonas marina TaxID=2872312 RepID=UPI001FF59159|nr:hypothetical protein [Kordiimonas marina]MCJ9430195.1 hypothetical protein [Kordiimonas marina]
MSDPTAALHRFILHEWQRDVAHEVMAAAQDIAARYEGSVAGILFYGSCLRTGQIADKILDFYVIVDSYRAAYASRWLRIANRLIPPNVFYHEIDAGGVTVRSKYAVLSRADLAFRTGPECLNVSVWARFCQPCLLLLPRDEATKEAIAGDVAQAAVTMIGNLVDLKPSLRLSRQLWVAAFEQTYAAELRSERGGKGLEIYLLDQDRYDRMTPLVLDALGLAPAAEKSAKQPARLKLIGPRLTWAARRINGKVISFLRLVKASMTFDGGIDYLAWKIRRHSGVEIAITPWMRRHPVLAGVSLFWGLRKKGAFK